VRKAQAAGAAHSPAIALDACIRRQGADQRWPEADTERTEHDVTSEPEALWQGVQTQTAALSPRGRLQIEGAGSSFRIIHRGS
jgi:hypothetical protein